MYEPGKSPLNIVIRPLPVVVAPPGVAVMVQSPKEGKLLNAILPVDTLQVGWVGAPIVGTPGTATIVTDVVTGTAGQPPDAGIV